MRDSNIATTFHSMELQIKSDYYVSFSVISDDGMIPTDTDSYDKYTFSARRSHKAGALTKKKRLSKNNFATTGQGLTHC
ncbi:hypothetical protein NXW89_31780, partial [Bacteroides thetaiotaomicron]|nr:hypothetical protein [Bacteroides thetaiotaomicron]